MKLLTLSGQVLWRVQLLCSFLALNIFPVAAAALVCGLLLATSQGSELVEDLWSGKFIQDGLAPDDGRQMLFAVGATAIWGCMLWLTSRLLCDMPPKKSLVGYMRVHADAADARFLRQIGPTFLAISAVAPLASILVIWTWSSIISISLGDEPDGRIMFARALSVSKTCALILLACYICLYDQVVRWRKALASTLRSAPLSTIARSWRTLFFSLGCFFLVPALLALPGDPSPTDLTPKSIHGIDYYNVHAISRSVWASLIIGLVFILTSYKIVVAWLKSPQFTPSTMLRPHYLRNLFLLQLAISGILVAFVTYDNVSTAQRIGVITLIMGLGIFWSTLLSLGLVLLPRRLGGPSLALLPVILFVAVSGRNNNHDLQTIHLPIATQQALWADSKSAEDCMVRENQAAMNEIDQHLAAWLRARIPANTGAESIKVPLIVVAGSGGGIRAAEFFAHALITLDDKTAGRFGDHVFAMSTVSGASLGAAVWIKARRAAYDDVSKSQGVSFWSTRTLAYEFFNRDYMSPVVGAMLTRDAVQQFLPFTLTGGDRARVMETSWEQGWTRGVDAKLPNATQEFRSFGKLSDLARAGTTAHPAPPLVVFNSTEVHTGRRFLTASAKLPLDAFPDAYIAIGPCSMHGTMDMSLATAAHLSARFTLVSPAATLKSAMDQQAWEAGGWERKSSRPVPWGQLVDGGYFENYGATTAKQLSEAIVASFARLKARKLISSSLTLMVLGLEIVNDPLDLENSPLYAVNRVVVENFGRDLRMGTQRSYERRFEALWPIANSYDSRELLGLFGVSTPLQDLESGRHLDNELMAPLSAVLKTRESRGQTAEREFAYYLLGLNRHQDTSVAGFPMQMRLARMLRDANSLRYNQASFPGDPQRPQFVRGKLTMPNPGLAWKLSSKSENGILQAIDSITPSRYQSETEIERVLNVFRWSCGGNPICTVPDSPSALPVEVR